MIKAVLLDLDDTLVDSQTNTLFSRYLAALGNYGSRLGSPEDVAKYVMGSYLTALRSYDPARSLADRFFDALYHNIGSTEDLRPFFDRFYQEHYPALVQDYVRPRPAAQSLVHWLIECGVKVVVATNPGLPEVATLQRMRQGGLAPQSYSFSLITTLETMHFGKPQPEYYEEITLRLDVDASEAIMVGDDWENDIAPAMAAGLRTFWIATDDLVPSNASLPDGWGTLEQFSQRVRAGWLETIPPRTPGHEALVRRLAAFPAGIAAAIEGHSPQVLECEPEHLEWSARDIICHLRDHDKEEDRRRLERILTEDNPFLSANYDPWAHAHNYTDVPVELGMRDLVRSRAGLVEWLSGLPDEAWNRPARNPIFGPTTFEEMVRFTTEHDRTHLRQMREAIAYAETVCGVEG